MKHNREIIPSRPTKKYRNKIYKKALKHLEKSAYPIDGTYYIDGGMCSRIAEQYYGSIFRVNELDKFTELNLFKPDEHTESRFLWFPVGNFEERQIALQFMIEMTK